MMNFKMKKKNDDFKIGRTDQTKLVKQMGEREREKEEVCDTGGN